MVLKILLFPDSRLRTVASEVEDVNAEIKTLCENMLETMYECGGIGLAATQVNVHKRVIVIDISPEKDSPLVLINPKIKVLPSETKLDYEEGCLSVPGFFETINRPDSIEVDALDKNGKEFNMKAEGFLAVVIQHENDHLEGKVFVDYLSGLKRQRIRKQLIKQKKVASK
tara:strand:+ start:1034 stop:1543 length:510 start_codon:yes stop_codon:yes gene_type:complete